MISWWQLKKLAPKRRKVIRRTLRGQPAIQLHGLLCGRGCCWRSSDLFSSPVLSRCAKLRAYCGAWRFLSSAVSHAFSFLFFLSFISLIADGHNVVILPVVTKDLPISPWFTPYDFLSRCKFRTRTTLQPMVEFYFLTYYNK